MIAGRDEATLTTSNLAAGTHTVTAVYHGDRSFYTGSPATAHVTTTTPPTVLSLRRKGNGYQPTQLILTFNLPRNAATVQDFRNYLLYPIGPNGVAGPNPQALPIVSAVYNPVDRTVTLTTRSRLKLSAYYLLTVSGMGSHSVADVYGDPLTATGTVGRPGDYIAVAEGNGPWYPTTAVQSKAMSARAPYQSDPGGRV